MLQSNFRTVSNCLSIIYTANVEHLYYTVANGGNIYYNHSYFTLNKSTGTITSTFETGNGSAGNIYMIPMTILYLAYR
jgi:hypothetical protein